MYPDNNNMMMNNNNMMMNANMNKYMEYKKMCDYHHGKCEYYKSKSKVKYMKHYKHYKYYYVKMMKYAGHDHQKDCETHTHYKHYYHHHHIEKHHHHCDDSSSSSSC